MENELWGYIHIEAESVPPALYQEGLFEDRAWASYPDRHGFWLNCGEKPYAEEKEALEAAKQYGLIEDFSIRPYTVEDLARRWS